MKASSANDTTAGRVGRRAQQPKKKKKRRKKRKKRKRKSRKVREDEALAAAEQNKKDLRAKLREKIKNVAVNKNPNK